MSVYYNENDPFAAAWLRELMRDGLIAPGWVDERSIEDVLPLELQGFTQCHFFAGIGVWSLALRVAGWPDDRPIWTGSCPCQPFSAAGKGAGFADERHLWPHWFWLIDQCRPATVLGEQVASKDGLGWLDLVSADLEGAGYAFGASDLCAAGFGGAHIRQRLYFVGVGNAPDEPRQRFAGTLHRTEEGEHGAGLAVDGPLHERSGDASESVFVGLADAAHKQQHGGGHAGQGRRAEYTVCGGTLGLGNPDSARAPARVSEPPQRKGGDAEVHDDRGDRLFRPGEGRPGADGVDASARTSAPLLGRHPADWLFCRDGKWRPVEPGTFPLAHAAPARVGRLRAYGNALDAETAQGFVGAVMELLDS